MNLFTALSRAWLRLIAPVAICLAMLACQAHARPFRAAATATPIVEAANHWPLTIGACFIVAALSYPVVRYLVSRYQKLVALRKNAAIVATALASYGLTLIPDFLTCFSVNDPEGMVNDLEKAAHIFSQQPAAVITYLDGVFTNVLRVKLQSNAGRAAVQAALAAAATSPATS